MDCQEQEAVPGEKWPKAGLTVAPLGPRASGRVSCVGYVMLVSPVFCSVYAGQTEQFSPKISPKFSPKFFPKIALNQDTGRGWGWWQL